MKSIVDIDNEQLMSFIKEDVNCYNYLHVTDSEENAKNIMNTGFKYTDNFYKTVDQFQDLQFITLNWIRILRKDYGDFVILIQIDKNLLKRNGHDIDTLAGDTIQERGEYVYVLPKEYVKGYFNERTQKIIRNPYFNPKSGLNK